MDDPKDVDSADVRFARTHDLLQSRFQERRSADQLAIGARLCDKLQTNWQSCSGEPARDGDRGTSGEADRIGQQRPVHFLGIFLSLIHISEPTRQAEISYAVF